MLPTGETVEAALENALDELSVTADDVEYEVLQEPKDLFGLRNTKTQIKTRVRQSQPLNAGVVALPDQEKERKKAKAHRPKSKSTSGKQKQQRRSPNNSRKKNSLLKNKCSHQTMRTTMARQSQTPRLVSAH